MVVRRSPPVRHVIHGKEQESTAPGAEVTRRGRALKRECRSNKIQGVGGIATVSRKKRAVTNHAQLPYHLHDALSPLSQHSSHIDDELCWRCCRSFSKRQPPCEGQQRDERVL